MLSQLTAEKTITAAAPVQSYLRPGKRFPTVWCPGCGIGTVFGTILRTIDGLGLSKDEVAMVSGIGCTGRMPVYADLPAMHTTHGRALAFATGLKLAQPGMTVVVVMGDGDAVGIGGNHFLHAARRNMDLIAIVVNNSIYGMTGGQCSPSTPLAAKTTTSINGNLDDPIDIAELAAAAGANFVARGTTYHVVALHKLMEQAFQRKGFSVIEVVSQCPTHFGRFNGAPSPVEMLKRQRDETVPVTAGGASDKSGKITRGVLIDRDRAGYVERYRQLMLSAAEGGR
ncbi:MAG: 2-oxoacid:ferredoxin oxidoreductase subunit beta [Chloroflexota bacterium]|nr:MAG: 2-oxoacid:ferredoxin oxidoreductase subunit beta [Chloroflexota bacterium]